MQIAAWQACMKWSVGWHSLCDLWSSRGKLPACRRLMTTRCQCSAKCPREAKHLDPVTANSLSSGNQTPCDYCTFALLFVLNVVIFSVVWVLCVRLILFKLHMNAAFQCSSDGAVTHTTSNDQKHRSVTMEVQKIITAALAAQNCFRQWHFCKNKEQKHVGLVVFRLICHLSTWVPFSPSPKGEKVESYHSIKNVNMTLIAISQVVKVTLPNFQQRTQHHLLVLPLVD